MSGTATVPRLLVVGATGILAPLAQTAAAAGAVVTGVSRAGAAGETDSGARALAADTTTDAGARAVTAAGPFDQAVLYEPAVTDETLGVIAAAVRGRTVLVLTSGAADPADAADPDEVFADRRPRPGDPVLLLGWAPPGRWHTPAEVSAAAGQALLDGADAILGTVRPWSDRP